MVSTGRFILVVLLLDTGWCQKQVVKSPQSKGVKLKAKMKSNNTPTASPTKAEVKPSSAQTPTPPAQTHLTQVLDRGRFQKVEEWLTVAAGDTLELRCKGKPVQWAVPYLLEEENDGRLRTVQHQRYGTLTVVNSTGADTGEYTCYPVHCEDAGCRKVYENAAKVFVFFPDPQELFVPSDDYYQVIQMRSNRPSTLPCQVTSPLAKVTLHREFPPEEVPVDGREITYHATKGFTIHRPSAHHAGALYCVASLDLLKQSSTKYILIYTHYPLSPPSPLIQTSSKSVHVGDNLQVTCSVLGEMDVTVDFSWEYPGQKVGRPLYTQETLKLVRSNGHPSQRSQSVLLVDEVRDVDQGTYTCTAQNLQGSRSVTISVKVLPSNKPQRPSPPPSGTGGGG